MNILVPDNWLRDFLKTDATPKEIKEYLSLCGPSVERMNQVGRETVYDVEITTNRPDSMSIVGVAREAAAILPRFGKKAQLEKDPYRIDTKKAVAHLPKSNDKVLAITTDPILNPRFTAIVIEHVTVSSSPSWMAKRLEETGIRSINNVVDVTNYIMKMYGQPVHAFDFDKIRPIGAKAVMKLRASKKGEKLTTLDGKTHALPGGDIVIEDSSGRLIDLCGIMGGENSDISDKTKTVILFMQTYNPVNIRRTSMSLAHRTEAGALFEKSLDPELVLPAIITGIDLMMKLTKGIIASELYDLYPKPYKPYTVSVTKEKLVSYIGTTLPDVEIVSILESLGFRTSTTARDVSVIVPSFRRDVTLDVDVIEEVARIYGYHKIETHLPQREPPVVMPNVNLSREEELKHRLRDWGYTETYTYSMISKKLMEMFHLPTNRAYTIENPLSQDWVYMRPSVLPSMLSAVGQNLHTRDSLSLFELSIVYEWRPNDLPKERPLLMVAVTGNELARLKGLAQAIFQHLGIKFPTSSQGKINEQYAEEQFGFGDWG